MTCIYTGAYVHFVEYGTYALADLFQIGDTIVVHLPGALSDKTLGEHERQPLRSVSHEVCIGGGFHRRGVVVVPKASSLRGPASLSGYIRSTSLARMPL